MYIGMDICIQNIISVSGCYVVIYIIIAIMRLVVVVNKLSLKQTLHIIMYVLYYYYV